MTHSPAARETSSLYTFPAVLVALTAFVAVMASNGFDLTLPFPYALLARASGWSSWLCLALALCVSPLLWLREHFNRGNALPAKGAALRRTLGMTSAWFALLHAALGSALLFDRAHSALAWLVDTAHVRAGLCALLILMLLLWTSYPSVVRAIHLREWKALHRLATIAFLFAAQHVLLSPFAPRAWVLGMVATILLSGALRLLPRGRRQPRPDV